MFEPILLMQGLRYRFLLIREVCRCSAGFDVRISYFRDAALLGWRASRLIGGWLQGHPNIQYHPQSTPISRLVLRSHAILLGLAHCGLYRRTRWLHGELSAVGRACADIRAVTSSVTINELLGPRQTEVAALLRATGAATAGTLPAPRAAAAVTRGGAEQNWPFLSV